MACAHPLFKKRGDCLIPIPCGYCMPCRVRKSQDLTFQLNTCLEECYKAGGSAVFATLTYRESALPLTTGYPLPRRSNSSRLPPAPDLSIRSCSVQPTLRKSDFQLFNKRFRKAYKTLTGNEIKFVACGEYGDKFGRPHYHLACIGISLPIAKKLINEAWTDDRGIPLGKTDIGTLRAGGFAYITKYFTKSEMGFSANLSYDDNGLERPFILHSKQLIYNYINKNWQDLDNSFTYVNKGKKIPIPAYYRRMLDVNHIYQPDTSKIAFECKKYGCLNNELYEYKGLLANYLMTLDAVKKGVPVYDAPKNMVAPTAPYHKSCSVTMHDTALNALDPVPF